MAYLEVLVLCILIFFLLYKWSTATFNTFKQRGIVHEPPWPLLGNVRLDVLFNRTSSFRATIEQYMKFQESKVVGVYNMRKPVLFLRDVELIKQIAIKYFEHFSNHHSVLPDSSEAFLSKSLIALKDRKWRKMRNTLTPTFTGSKMRLMYELINACSVEAVKYIAAEVESNAAKGVVELEMKDYFTRFTNDVIASAAFGINVNSFKDKDNDFFTIGKSVTSFSGIAMIKMILLFIMPKVSKVLGIRLFDEAKTNYFNKLVIETMKYREEHNIIRPDMIHLLMEAKRDASAQTDEAQLQFDDEDYLAQCLLFFFAGFETVSKCLCFTTYELLMNANVQDKLYQEILAMEAALNGKPLNYDALMKMKYMDMVISESLRKWPPAFATDRVCSADIDLKDEAGNLILSMKKDDMIFIPIIGLHHDPANFPEPLNFRPERFSEQNINEIKPHTFLPFGIGPRNCIGNRLALMEVKSIIYYLLLHFRLEPSNKTVVNMAESIRGFQMQPKELFWTKCVPRLTSEINDSTTI